MLLFFIRHGDPTYDPDELTPLGKRQAEAVARRLARYGLDEIYSSSSNRALQTAEPTCELLKKKVAVLDWANEHHAWAKQSVELPEGRRQWAFFTKKYRDAFTSKEMRELADKWYEHPLFNSSEFTEGYFQVKKEARSFLLQLGFEWDEERGQYKNLRLGEITEPGDGGSHACGKKTINGEPAEKPGRWPDRVAVFAHHGIGMNFLSAVLNIPFPEVVLKLNFGHTGMTVINFDEGEYSIPQLLTLSNDGHLLADNLPTAYNNEIYY